MDQLMFCKSLRGTVKVTLRKKDVETQWKLSLGPRHEKTCLQGFANNKGADQSAHPHRLTSDFVIRVLVSVVSCLFDLILYVPSTIYQLNRDGSSWVEPVLS